MHQDFSTFYDEEVRVKKEALQYCSLRSSVSSKKSPNVYKSCPKMISQEKWMILTPLQKLPNNVGKLGKTIVATCFEKLPKVQ